MKHIVQALAAQGRNGDDMLVHVSRKELQGLQAISGQRLTRNPTTGLPEAYGFDWTSLIPMAAGVAGTMVGGPAGGMAAGAAAGGIRAKAQGTSVGMGLATGLAAGYGGSGIAQAGMGMANAGAAGATAAPATDLAASGASSAATMGPTTAMPGGFGALGDYGEALYSGQQAATAGSAAQAAPVSTVPQQAFRASEIGAQNAAVPASGYDKFKMGMQNFGDAPLENKWDMLKNSSMTQGQMTGAYMGTVAAPMPAGESGGSSDNGYAPEAERWFDKRMGVWRVGIKGDKRMAEGGVIGEGSGDTLGMEFPLGEPGFDMNARMPEGLPNGITSIWTDQTPGAYPGGGPWVGSPSGALHTALANVGSPAYVLQKQGTVGDSGLGGVGNYLNQYKQQAQGIPDVVAGPEYGSGGDGGFPGAGGEGTSSGQTTTDLYPALPDLGPTEPTVDDGWLPPVEEHYPQPVGDMANGAQTYPVSPGGDIIVRDIPGGMNSEAETFPVYPGNVPPLVVVNPPWVPEPGIVEPVEPVEPVDPGHTGTVTVNDVPPDSVWVDQSYWDDEYGDWVTDGYYAPAGTDPSGYNWTAGQFDTGTVDVPTVDWGGSTGSGYDWSSGNNTVTDPNSGLTWVDQSYYDEDMGDWVTSGYYAPTDTSSTPIDTTTSAPIATVPSYTTAPATGVSGSGGGGEGGSYGSGGSYDFGGGFDTGGYDWGGGLGGGGGYDWGEGFGGWGGVGGGGSLGPHPIMMYEKGGLIDGMAGGGLASVGQYLRGPGDGMSDHIPAEVGGPGGRPIRVAANEYVVPADVVSHLGNGSSDAGARVLDQMGSKVRKARTGNPKQGKRINPAKFTPR